MWKVVLPTKMKIQRTRTVWQLGGSDAFNFDHATLEMPMQHAVKHADSN